MKHSERINAFRRELDSLFLRAHADAYTIFSDASQQVNYVYCRTHVREIWGGSPTADFLLVVDPNRIQCDVSGRHWQESPLEPLSYENWGLLANLGFSFTSTANPQKVYSRKDLETLPNEIEAIFREVFGATRDYDIKIETDESEDGERPEDPRRP